MRRELPATLYASLAVFSSGAAAAGWAHAASGHHLVPVSVADDRMRDAAEDHASRAVTRSQTRISRRYFTSRLAEPRVVGDEDGVLLERPTHLRATGDGGFVLFDYGDMTVRRFGAGGRLLWTVGGRGQGPGRLAQGTDLRVTPRGEVVVLDNNNGRLTTITAEGRVAAMARVEEPARGLLGVAGGNVTAVIPFGTDTLWRVPITGSVQRSQPMPKRIALGSNLVAESYATERQGRSVLVFRWADQFVVLARDGTVARTLSGIDSIPFPDVSRQVISPTGLTGRDGARVTQLRVSRVDERAEPATRGATVWRRTLLVIAARSGSDSTSILDAYDIDSGAYQGSLALPVRASGVAVLDAEHLAVLDTELVPVVRIWRVVPSGTRPLRLER
jgi:hypothetical protein